MEIANLTVDGGTNSEAVIARRHAHTERMAPDDLVMAAGSRVLFSAL
jgi:hypothetical protein